MRPSQNARDLIVEIGKDSNWEKSVQTEQNGLSYQTEDSDVKDEDEDKDKSATKSVTATKKNKATTMMTTKTLKGGRR